MNDLGICPETNAVYEGSWTTHAHRVFPAPLLLPIRFVGKDGLRPIDSIDGYAADIFREESFDPVTKIRRGRVFSRRHHSALKFEWHVQDPMRLDLPVKQWAHGQAQAIWLVTYAADPLLELRKPENVRHRPKIVLGWDEHCTWWRIVSIESPIRGAPVLTLRALYSFGDLPDLIEEALPLEIRQSLAEAWERVDGAVSRSAPPDVIDGCRDALSIVFGHLAGDRSQDLSAAVKAYVAIAKREELKTHAARIVALLHPRRKPNEQHDKGLRAPADHDAELAVRCLGVVLVDLKWAR